MFSERLIKQCFALIGNEAHSQWRRALTVADHAFAQEFIDPDSGKKLQALTIDEGQSPHRIVLLTTGGYMDQLLLHALSISQILNTVDPLKSPPCLVILHALPEKTSPSLAEPSLLWSLESQDSTTQQNYQSHLLKSAQERLSQENTQPPIPQAAFGSSTIKTVCQSLLADANFIAVVDLRTGFDTELGAMNPPMRLQSLEPPLEGSPWPEDFDQIAQAYYQNALCLSPNLKAHCPRSTLWHGRWSIGLPASRILLQHRQLDLSRAKSGKDSFAQLAKIPEQLDWQRTFLEQGQVMLDQIGNILQDLASEQD